MALFRNFYRCDQCGHEWSDEWSAMCDDDCPQCGARHVSPYKSEDAVEGASAVDEPQQPVATEAATTNGAKTTARIRELNDQLRSTFVGGRVLVTPGVRSLPLGANTSLLERVRTFTDFSSDNDPYGQHDFGTIEIEGETFFWKIDYYDRSMEGGSEDPADPTKTTRVLTIMRADEY